MFGRLLVRPRAVRVPARRFSTHASKLAVITGPRIASDEHLPLGRPPTLAAALLAAAQRTANGITYVHSTFPNAAIPDFATPASRALKLAASNSHAATRAGSVGVRLHHVPTTYAELLQRAKVIHTSLHRQLSKQFGESLAPSQPLLLQIADPLDFVPALWSCLISGSVAVPASTPSSGSYGGDAESGARLKLGVSWRVLKYPVILTTKALEPSLRACLVDWLKSDSEATKANGGAGVKLRILTIEDLLNSTDDSHPLPSVTPAQPALFVMTSGTTSAPKAVVLTHGNVTAQIDGQTHALARSLAASGAVNSAAAGGGFVDLTSDSSLNSFPLYHAGGLLMTHLRDTVWGIRQYQIPAPHILANPTAWCDLMSAHACRFGWGPNYLYELVGSGVRAALNEARGGRPGAAVQNWDLSRIRVLLNGGECILNDTTKLFADTLAPYGLKRSVIHPAWGLAETSSLITVTPYVDPDAQAAAAANTPASSVAARFVPVGEPIAGATVRIVNESDEVVLRGEVGRVQITGPSVFQSYFNYTPPTTTNSAVSPVSAFTRDNYFDTLDHGFIDAHSGALTITGRGKNLILVDGIFYYCHEVEHTVKSKTKITTATGEVVSVVDAAALAVRVPQFKREVMVVFFVPSQPYASLLGTKSESDADAQLDLVDSRSLASSHPVLSSLVAAIHGVVKAEIGLAPHFMVPVTSAMIPRTSIGKIQHALLRQDFEKLYREKHAQPLAPAA